MVFTITLMPVTVPTDAPPLLIMTRVDHPNVAAALEKVLDIPADMWMNMQTQYELDKANIASRDGQRETVSLTIPIRDRNLLRELVRKFGWACVF